MFLFISFINSVGSLHYNLKENIKFIFIENQKSNLVHRIFSKMY